MYVEKYSFEIIKAYMKNINYKNVKVVEMYIEKYLRFDVLICI